MADKVVFSSGKKTITVAEFSGFCYGVEAAIKKTEDAAKCYAHAEENGGYKAFHSDGKDDKKTKVYTFGPIIHNDDVVNDLKKKGVDIRMSTEEVSSDDIIVIRSHGISRDTENILRERSEAVIDATCPYVKAIHNKVSKAYEAGRDIIIVGDASHPEVIGINGWCEDSAFILNGTEDIEVIKNIAEICKTRRDAKVESGDTKVESGDVKAENSDMQSRMLVVAQTTMNREIWDVCTEKIKSVIADAEISCTICNATVNRQRACRRVAENSDMMIVVGGRNSSNSRKLFEIASKLCTNTLFIENISFLPLKDIAKYNKIGISAGASTPARIIKEVISNMSDIITNIDEANEMNAYMAEIEKSLKMPQRGEIVKGEIIQMSDREIYINLGCKKDGIIPKDEMVLPEGETIESQFKMGDVVEAKVIKTDDGDGNILLSRKKIELSAHWNEISAAYENKEVVVVKVIREVKGGVIAAYKELTGFIPMSQLNDRYVEKADEFIGKELEVKVTRVDRNRNKAVFSHKAYLNEEKSKRLAEIWATLKVDSVVEGTVMRFTDYGAFVDVGGIDGLLHISEISWGKLRHPKEALEIGQKINVKILSMNEEKGKISLGLKQNTPEPWSVINENYHIGQVVEGKVVQIKEYGAFVELEPGLDGLVHISEIAHKRVANIADEISIGQIVNAKILDIDEEKRRISLSIKATISPDEEAAADAAAEAEAAEEDAPVEEAVAEEAPVEAEEAAVAEEAPVEEAAE